MSDINKQLTTFSTKVDRGEISMDSIKEAIDCLPPRPEKEIVKIVFCKKHWKQFKENLNVEVKKQDSILSGMFGDLTGIKVEIKPYIKKIRTYWKRN